MHNRIQCLIAKNLVTGKLIVAAIATCIITISCATAPLAPLRVTCNVWLGYEPLFLARDLGYFADTPIQIADIAATHSQLLKVLLEGWFKALQYIETNPEDAIARIAEREGMTVEQVTHGLSQLLFPNVTENIAIFERSDTNFVVGMKRLAAFLEQQQILTTTLDPSNLLDFRPLESVS